MLYKKEGFPEEDEFVLCTITKIQYHSVFCHIDMYDRSGMIHISEIAPGRIRNIRDYVQEGKKVVCKVLKIDEEKGHVDLSLRRVTEAQKKAHLSLIKQEQKAEKIVEILAEREGKKVKSLYKEITDALFEHYEMLFIAFEDVVEEDLDLEDKGLDKKIAEPLMEIIREKIKPKRVSIKGIMTLTSYDPEGVEVVREAAQQAETEGVEVRYIGSGKYRITVTAPDYKKAESIMEESVKKATAVVEKGNGKAEFQRR